MAQLQPLNLLLQWRETKKKQLQQQQQDIKLINGSLRAKPSSIRKNYEKLAKIVFYGKSFKQTR